VGEELVEGRLIVRLNHTSDSPRSSLRPVQWPPRVLGHAQACARIDPNRPPVRTPGKPTRPGEEMSMTSTARTTVGRRLGVLIAGSLVVTALTAGTAAASMPTPMGIASPGIGLRDGSSSRPRTPVPGFLLERGRYTRFDAPGAVQQTNALGINNRG
jgi:hypothetical protein